MRLPSYNTLGIRFGSTEYPYSKDDSHKGLDILPDNDYTIHAPFKGIVIQNASNGRDGNGTYMMHPSGDFHGMLHAERYLVPNGALVEEGQPIAIMGYTGFVVPSGERGRHLHYCVKRNGVFIDPLSLITGGRGADDMTITNRAEGKKLYLMVQHRQCTDQEADGIIGKTLDQIYTLWIDDAKNNEEWLKKNHYILKYPELEQEAKALRDFKAAHVSDPVINELAPGIYKVK